MKGLIKSAVMAAGIFGAASASASVIQLGFILDESGSIGSGNWTTIVNGLSNAVNSIPVGGTDQYEITVVPFQSTAYTAVDRILLTDASVRTSVANTIASIPYSSGGTNFAAAFGEMYKTLTNGGADPLLDATYLNFATDGQGTSGISQVNQLIAAGVDNISVEGIGTGVNKSALMSGYCYPGPCTTYPTVNFPSQGFYIAVADAQGYADAIGKKVGIVTGQVPEPGSLLLLGLGLVGLVAARRRRA